MIWKASNSFGRLIIANKNALLQAILTTGRRKANRTAFRFFHPDYTVGPGITPDQRLHQQPVAGLWQCHLPPVGNCTPPWNRLS